MLIWSCMSLKGTGNTTFIDHTVNTSLYPVTLNENMISEYQETWLERSFATWH